MTLTSSIVVLHSLREIENDCWSNIISEILAHSSINGKLIERTLANPAVTFILVIRYSLGSGHVNS